MITRICRRGDLWVRRSGIEHCKADASIDLRPGLLQRISDLDDAFIRAGDGAVDDDDAILRIDLHDLQILHGVAFISHVARPFLDDIGGNLRTAKKLGMNTIKVTLGRADLAVAELEKLTRLQLRDNKARL